MNEGDLKAMIDEVAEQDGVVVIRVLRQTITLEAMENYGFDCSYCNQRLVEGAAGYLAGIPTGDTLEAVRESTLVTLPLFCDEACLNRYVNEWGRDLDYEDMMIAFYG